MPDPELIEALEALGKGGDLLADSLGRALAALERLDALTEDQMDAGRTLVALWHRLRAECAEAQA